MANDYDKILRDNFREPKQHLLRQLIPADIISILPLVPKLQQTIIERETDTIAEIQTQQGEHFIVHIEWQSSNDPDMALRMANYDLMLHQTYKMDVMGIVLYVGRDQLRMKESISFFDFHYSCQMIDVRLLDPETLLASNDPGEIIFAVLAGNSKDEHKQEIIRRIFAKLQLLFSKDQSVLRIKLKQLELLSLLRGKDIQQFIIQEEQKMPVTIDIREDLRYQQGLGEGIEQTKTATAEKLFRSGMDILFVQNITSLPLETLEKIAQAVSKK